MDPQKHLEIMHKYGFIKQPITLNMCNICSNIKETMVVFDNCGHMCCSCCSKSLKNCHICRKNIIKKIQLYPC